MSSLPARPARPRLEGFQRAFIACWALLGTFLVGEGVFELLPARNASPGTLEPTLFVPGFFFLLIALFYARAWLGYRALVGCTGTALALYGVALVLLGTPYVGGFVVSVPGGAICVGLGIWSLLLSVAEPLRARAGAG